MSKPERKMSGKQEVAGGFDLNAFVSGADQPEAAPQASETPVEAAKPKKRPKPLVETKKTPEVAKIKPQRVANEPLSARVQIRITQAELDEIEAKAGMVPVSKFLRNFLKDTGLLS